MLEELAVSTGLSDISDKIFKSPIPDLMPPEATPIAPVTEARRAVKNDRKLLMFSPRHPVLHLQ